MTCNKCLSFNACHNLMTLALCGMCFVSAVILILRWKVYLSQLRAMIQFDQRYRNDIEWRREADRVCLLGRVERFALKHGVIHSVPTWLFVAKFAPAAAFLSGIMSLVVCPDFVFGVLLRVSRAFQPPGSP